MEKQRLIIFGANADGEYLYRQIKPLIWLDIIELLAFCDNDSGLSGLSIEGINIINPNEIKNYPYDKIIIAPIFYEEILKQLLELGVESDCIKTQYQEEFFSRKDRKFRSNTVGRYSYFKPTTKIYLTDIGSFCHIGDNCIIGQCGHDTRRITTYPLSYHFSNTINDASSDESGVIDQLENRTTIKNDVYIGEGVVIFSGVTIGNGAVIGSRAVVTKDIPDYAIVGGIPAKIIRYRFSEEIIKNLLQICWWDWSDDVLKARSSLFNENPEKFIQVLLKD